MTRIQTQRITHIKNIINNPEIHPLESYYLGLRLQRWLPFRNTQPRCTHTLRPYYKFCVSVLKHFNKDMLTEPPKQIYEMMIERQHKDYTDIKWSRKYRILHQIESFQNIHRHDITPRVREIAYRLLYSDISST